MVTLVTEDFLHGAQFEESKVESLFRDKAEIYRAGPSLGISADEGYKYSAVLQQMQNNLEGLTALSPSDCRSTFSSTNLPSLFSNVLLITKSPETDMGSIVGGDLLFPEMLTDFENLYQLGYRNWFSTSGRKNLLHNRCSNTNFNFGIDNSWNVPVWDNYCTVTPYPVSYCLAQPFDAGCGTMLDTRTLVAATVGVLIQFTCLALVAFSNGNIPLGTRSPNTFSH